MASSVHADADLIIAKLESIFALSDDERAALMRLPIKIAVLEDDQTIVREGDRPSRCCALLDGFACSHKMTADGRRQITAFYVPGDIPDLQSLHLATLDASISTLSRCRVGFILHEDMRALCASHPRLVEALWRETLVDGAIYREWVLNLGQREALNRMAHVLCELVARLQAVGRMQDLTFDMPVTQAEFGDALGLSTVHVNRTVQALRARGLITLRAGSLVVNDWEGLQRLGGFDPTYLHLERQGAN